MVRILTLNYEYPPLGGGASPVTAELAQQIVDRGHHVDVVTMRYDDYPRKENDEGVTVYRTASLRNSKAVCHTHEMLSFLPTGFWRANCLVKEHDYDVIHTHFLIPTGVISAILSRRYDIPTLVTAHGSDIPNYNPDRFGALHALIRPLWRRIVGSHDLVVSPSDYLASKIRTEVAPNELIVIPNGFDPGTFNTSVEKQPRILVTGRHFQRKGIQHLLHALVRVETSWEIVITGEGPYTENLIELADELDLDVDFVGWIERETLDQLLQTSEICVFPSSHENCPVALQEAMAAGCAVLTSQYGGSAELIGNAGVTVDPEDIEVFAVELQSLVEDTEKRRNLQELAERRIRSRYPWDEITDEYLDAMMSLIETQS